MSHKQVNCSQAPQKGSDDLSGVRDIKSFQRSLKEMGKQRKVGKKNPEDLDILEDNEALVLTKLYEKNEGGGCTIHE